MSVTKKLKKGQARMQFTACKDRIHQLQEAGCDIRMIYNNLIDEGLITMTYGGFYENFTQRRKKVICNQNAFRNNLRIFKIDAKHLGMWLIKIWLKRKKYQRLVTILNCQNMKNY